MDWAGCVQVKWLMKMYKWLSPPLLLDNIEDHVGRGCLYDPKGSVLDYEWISPHLSKWFMEMYKCFPSLAVDSIAM